MPSQLNFFPKKEFLANQPTQSLISNQVNQPQTKKGVIEMKSEVADKIAALVTAAFGLVAALAWNGAIQAIFKRVFGTAEGIGPMLIYAIVVTIIAVIVTIWIGKVAERSKSA